MLPVGGHGAAVTHKEYRSINWLDVGDVTVPPLATDAKSCSKKYSETIMDMSFFFSLIVCDMLIF